MNKTQLNYLHYNIQVAIRNKDYFFQCYRCYLMKLIHQKRWINDNSFIWSQSQPLQIEYGEVLIHGERLLEINENQKTFNGGSKTKFYDNKLKILIDNWFGGFLHLGGFREDFGFPMDSF